MEYRLALDRGDHHQWIPLELADTQFWSPERPKLYHVEAILSSPTGVTSRIHGQFGMRKIEARGRYIYLNNEQLYLDGVLYQPGTASLAQMRHHLQAMKALGCNPSHCPQCIPFAPIVGQRGLSDLASSRGKSVLAPRETCLSRTMGFGHTT